MHLKGEEVVAESESDDEDIQDEKPAEVAKPSKKVPQADEGQRRKGDADSSSDEEDESEDDPHNLAASRKARNAQLKKDLEAE